MPQPQTEKRRNIKERGTWQAYTQDDSLSPLVSFGAIVGSLTHFDPDGSPPPRHILIRFALFLRPIYSFYFFLYKRPNCYRGNNRISRPPFNHSSFRRAPISFANFSLSLFALRDPYGRRRTSTIREKTAKNKIDIHKHTWERRENNIKSNFQYSTRSIHL